MKLEDIFLALLLLVMIVLAVLLIVLRNVFDSGLVWGDELLRILVLWLCMVGSMAASRDDNHLTIDVVSRFLPPRFQLGVRVATHLFTALICGTIAWYSWTFVRIEAEFGSQVLGHWPSWIAQSILPLGFGLITLRYLAHTVRKGLQLFRRGVSP
ncbi:MAG: TRAP transporter small permease [Desulfuromonas sp.]|nr:MAG: TRAP transporter small permease [Desulfuromonas sp.]